MEVANIFKAHIKAREAFLGEPHRKRQGMVPDFQISGRARTGRNGRERLADVKVIHDGKTRYQARHMSGHGLAVETRAAAVHKEYHRKAKKVDVDYNACDPNSDALGPVQRKLDSFGRVNGLVVGSYGEASEDLLNLMHEIAKVGATRCWRDMGARDPLEGERILYTRLRRRLGITAVRARARMLVSRVNHILDGPGARLAADRRATNRNNWRQLRIERGSLGGFAVGAF